MAHFDVKTTHSKPKDTIGARSINLMCEITKNITYKSLYTEPIDDASGNSTLDALISNVESLPAVLRVGAMTSGDIVYPRLMPKLTAIKSLLNGKQPVRLQRLFYEDLSNPDSSDTEGLLLKGIADLLESVHTPSKDEMFHFCVPFQTIQQKTSGKTRIPPNRRMPTKKEFDRFINYLGNKTMRDFYDNVEYGLRSRIETILALRLCILREHGRPGDPREIGEESREGNGMICSGSGCVPSNDPEDWCNEVEINGQVQCALGSDY